MAHNGNLLPVEGRIIMVQAWYQGGIAVTDWTHPYNPYEIAWFDRGPPAPTRSSSAALVGLLVQRPLPALFEEAPPATAGPPRMSEPRGG